MFQKNFFDFFEKDFYERDKITKLLKFSNTNAICLETITLFTLKMLLSNPFATHVTKFHLFVGQRVASGDLLRHKLNLKYSSESSFTEAMQKMVQLPNDFPKIIVTRTKYDVSSPAI